MSRTLFWYIFKDLLRIFFMASGALAGIMSFGGLLRPLTQNGLDGPQVALLLANFMPAMSTYSLPVAALFATTMVYGRMSADNEVTACRASGVSFAALTMPAMALGLVVAAGSLYLLCFTVPKATKQVEQVIYSNLAKLIAHEIQQTHRTTFDTYTVFARDATYLPPDDPRADPHQQAVLLRGPLIVSYVCPPGRPKWYQLAKDFWSSSEAVAKIVEDPDDGSATLTVQLTNGVVFPRTLSAAKVAQGGASAAAFGPVLIPSRVSEKTKFLDVFKLKQLQREPSQGQQVREALQQFIRADQAAAVADRLVADLRSPAHRAAWPVGGDTMSVAVPADATVSSANDAGTLVVTAPPGGPPVQFRQASGGQVRLTVEGHACRLAVAVPPGQDDDATVTVVIPKGLIDANEAEGGGDDTPVPAPLNRQFATPLPADVAAMRTRTAEQYLAGQVGTDASVRNLRFAWFDLVNHVSAELHARVAFVVSCLLLVVAGSSLGMMFRSGNFLTAFAVSVVPAMLSTVLIVTGQHAAESTPLVVTAARNPLHLGLAIIWSGNLAIGIGAVVLLTRLQRR